MFLNWVVEIGSRTLLYSLWSRPLLVPRERGTCPSSGWASSWMKYSQADGDGERASNVNGGQASRKQGVRLVFCPVVLWCNVAFVPQHITANIFNALPALSSPTHSELLDNWIPRSGTCWCGGMDKEQHIYVSLAWPLTIFWSLVSCHYYCSL